MARATGIHLILATAAPFGRRRDRLIKANFPARISFAVTSQIDSRVVLDTPGAEKLLGRGDMLLHVKRFVQARAFAGLLCVRPRAGQARDVLERLYAAAGQRWVHPTENSAPADDFVQPTLWGETRGKTKTAPGEDDLFPQAIEWYKQNHKASVSLLQRKLRIGYSRGGALDRAVGR